jgi:hypothetical protein
VVVTAAAPASDPAAALELLAAELGAEDGLVAEHVAPSTDAPALGLLVAAGPRCRERGGEYAAVVEAVREGWLLHYGEPRLLAGLEPDLRLLIGDHLYARGIERLATLGDMVAVAELADLISMTAQLDAAEASRAEREAVWLAAAVAIAVGPGDSHARDKAEVRASCDVRPLWGSAASAAERAGLTGVLNDACEAVGFRAADLG